MLTVSIDDSIDLVLLSSLSLRLFMYINATVITVHMTNASEPVNTGSVMKTLKPTTAGFGTPMNVDPKMNRKIAIETELSKISQSSFNV